MSKSNLEVHTERTPPPKNSSSIILETANKPLLNEKTKDYTEKGELEQDADMQVIVKSILKRCIAADVSDDACKYLADHCKDKLKKVVGASVDYMKRCGRQKFTVEDFNKGLMFCGERPFMPHELLDSTIRERDKSNTTTALECEQITPHVNTDEKIDNLPYLELSPHLPQSITRNERWLNQENPLSKDLCDLSDELQMYFREITKTLLVESEEVCSIIFNDFKTNKNIYYLVPHFVNFLCGAVDNYNSDFLRISILFKSIQSLLLNPNLYYGENMYLNMLAHTLLRFQLSHLPSINQGIDYCLLKDTAASILALILKRSNSKELFFHVLSEINSVLSDFMKGLDTHYGGLVTLNSLGVTAVLLLMPSYLDRYIEHMNSIFVLNYKNRQNACMIEGQMIYSHYLLVNHCHKYEFNRLSSILQFKGHSKFYLPGFLNDNNVFPILLQLKFKDYFGDSLIPGYPLLNSTSHLMQEMKEKEKQEKTETSSSNIRLHPKKIFRKKGLKAKHIYQLYSMLLL